MQITRKQAAQWRVIELTQLADNHHIFVHIEDDAGVDLRDTGVQVQLGWDGMQPDEQPAPIPIGGKPLGEYTSIPLWAGQRAWLEIANADSDRVTDMEVIGLGSFFVKFVRVR